MTSGAAEERARDDALAAAPTPVLIGGCPRSGTTLLGAMLGTGPDRVAVPEAVFKFRLLRGVAHGGELSLPATRELLAGDDFFRRWRIELPDPGVLPGVVSYRDLLGDLVTRFATAAGKPSCSVWIDHTPGNIRYAASLASLLPAARFVNVVRDGRGAAASVIPLDWGPNTVSEAATWWSTHIALGLAATQNLGSRRVTTVRYEDLLTRPEETLQELCRFVGTTYDPAMVSQRDYAARDYTMTEHQLVHLPPDPSRSRAWEHVLKPRQVEAFEHLTGELLALLGYDMTYGPAARLGSRPQRLADFGTDLARRAIIDRVRRRRSHSAVQ